MTDKLSIMVIDDEPLVGRSLKRLLSKAGYDVEAFTDSRAAVKELEKRIFNVIVTDLKMDGIDGMNILDIARNRCTDTKVIVISGFAQQSTVKDVLGRGASAFISKPFRINELKEAVIKAGSECKRE